MSKTTETQDLVIRPTTGWFEFNLGEVWRYRDLLILLVHREFISKYKQTILGPVWFVLQPLLMTAVFAVIFGSVAKIPTGGAPPVLFYLAGLLGWNYFAQTFQTTALTFTSNAGLFGKVYFPRLVAPLATVCANFLTFALQLGTLAVFWLYSKFFTASGAQISLDLSALPWAPLVILQLAALSLGAGLWLSALTAKYRDFAFLIPFLVQVWMYATPVIYPLSQVPERWRWLAAANPMTMPTEAIKLMALNAGTLTPTYVAISASVTLVLLLSGFVLFNKVEKTFVDVV